MQEFPRPALFEIILSVGLVVVLGLYYGAIFSVSSAFAVLPVVAFLGTVPVVIRALRSVFDRDWASMDMLASIALVFSLANAEWASSIFIALMLSAAHILSILTEARTERSIESLLKLRPETATVERGSETAQVPVEDLHVGDIIIADIGERIPVDGSVLSGDAAVDESSLTGESVPVEKSVGLKVFASTLVSSGNLRITVEKVGKDTTLEKIIELVKSAREQRSKIYTLAESFGKAYLIAIFVCAGLLLLFTQNTLLVLSVVLVVCADDVAVAVPLGYLNAIGSAAKRGVVVKGSAHLEALGRATTFVFDKTGTLTKGKLAVSGIVCVKDCNEQEVLEYAAIACRGSQHPLSKALIAYADAQGVASVLPEASHAVGGKGIVATHGDAHIVLGRATFLESEGIPIPSDIRDAVDRVGDQGHSVSLVAKNGKVLGLIELQDEVKPNAQETLQVLRALGAKHIIMLTGDNERVAKVIAEKLGITEWHAGLLPEDKVKRVAELSTQSDTVMVGDGVNDAAALTAATVGIAMGAIGYDAAIESAEIVLMRDDLSQIPATIELARFVHQISIQDFFIWGVTNIFGLALVFAGFIGPSGAAAYNFISDFFPLANAMRTRGGLPVRKNDPFPVTGGGVV